MMLLSSLLIALAGFYLVMTISSLFEVGTLWLVAREDEEGERHPYTPTGTIIPAAVFGLTLGAISYFAPRAGTVWLIVFAVAILAAYVALVVRWRRDGATLGQAACFILLFALLFFPASAVAVKLGGWVTALPLILTIGSVGYVIVNYLLFAAENEDDAKKSKAYRTGGWILAVLIAALLIYLIASAVKAYWPKKAEAADPAPAPVATEQRTYLPWYEFLSLRLQDDEDPDNNYNFAPNPYKEGMSAEDAYGILKAEAEIDPLIGCATYFYVDSVSGNTYMSHWRDQYKESGAYAANQAIHYYVEQEEQYKRLHKGVFAFIDDSMRKMEIIDGKEAKKRGLKITDQVYANPFMPDGIPAVVVYDCGSPENEHYLLITLRVKNGTNFVLCFHIECGMQLCNVSGVLGPSQGKPSGNGGGGKPSGGGGTTPSSGGGTKPGPSGGGGGGNTPTPPSNPKDPSRGTDVGPNDNPGPGEDTNNGPGATESTKDQPTNSGSMTLDEYWWWLGQLQDANDDDDDDGGPSTPTPPGANVENGDGGDIDTPTPVQPPASTEDGSDVTDDEGDGPWCPDPDSPVADDSTRELWEAGDYGANE